MRKLLFGLIVIALLIGIALQTGMARPLVKMQVESTLLESGMSEKRADCMAGRMVDRLTVWQLWTLRQAMAPQDGESEQPNGLGDTINRLRRSQDNEIVAVVTTSAGLCALGIG